MQLRSSVEVPFDVIHGNVCRQTGVPLVRLGTLFLRNQPLRPGQCHQRQRR